MTVEIKISESNTAEVKEKVHRIKDWIQVIAHVHSKLGILAFDKSFTPEQTRILQNWRAGQLTSLALAKGAAQLLDGGVTFTDHIKEGLQPRGEKLTEKQKHESENAYKKDTRQRTKNILSAIILLRAKAEQKLIEYHPELAGRFFTGVEVEIISPGGELNANNETLAKLDYVGASLHEGTWLTANEGQKPTAENLIHAYEILAQNPTVDIINHLFVFLPLEEFEKIKNNISLLDNFIKLMKRNNKAIELNALDLMSSINLDNKAYQKPKRYDVGELTIELAKYAKEKFGFTNFILGIDFHILQDYATQTIQTGKKDEAGNPVYLKQTGLSDETKHALQAITHTPYPFATKEEAQKFEEQIEKTIRQIFGNEGNKFSNDIIKFTRPLLTTIERLEEAGLTPDDIITSDLKKFKKWIEQRKKVKEDYLKTKVV